MKHFYTILFLISSLFVTAQTGNSSEVGITEGELSVSLSGGATYSTPLAVPPGINGVVPQISLGYNSQSGNGVAGFGWNISGISSITRIPKTKFHDNTVDAVSLNTNDRFALDGQRLIVKSGTSGVYGGDKTQYETENYSNIKISSIGVHPSGVNYGPAYFIVQYPDGSKAYYGNSTDSRSIASWSITYWENPQGVRISYNYLNSNNNLNIEYIKYGSTSINTPINQIQFIYKTRQRPEQAYIGGQTFLRNTILSQIKVSSNSVGFRNYALSHEITSLGYERLTKITETSGDGTKSYNPTVFTYDTRQESIVSGSIVTNIDMSDVSAYNTSYVSGDYNGDGSIDFILYPTYGTNAKKKYWFFSGLKTDGSLNIPLEQNIGAFDEIFTSTILTNYAGNYKLLPKQGWTIIKNNPATNTAVFSSYAAETGVSPIVLRSEKTIQFPTFSWGYPAICGNYSSYVTKTYEIPKKFFNGDFNGDGLTDAIAIEESLIYRSTCDRTDLRPGGNVYFANLDPRITTTSAISAGNISNYSGGNVQVADFNGDGKSDVYIFGYQKCSIYGMNANDQFVLLTEITGDINIASTRKVLFGDYNGDGKTDFYIQKVDNGNDYVRYLSSGTTLIKSATVFTPTAVTNPANTGLTCNNTFVQLIPTDINKDGKTDFVYIGKSSCKESSSSKLVNTTLSINLFKNMGESFSLESSTSLSNSSPIGTSALPIFLNFDKINSNMEIDFISDNKIFNFVSTKDFSIESLLKSVTTGNGVIQSIAYKPLVPENCSFNCKPLYAPETLVENYPNVDIFSAPSFQVVEKLEKKSASVNKKQVYSYYGAVSNVSGLGFLGFKATMKTNWHDDTTSIISTISKFDISRRGANTETYTVNYQSSPSSSFAPTDFISKAVMTYNTAIDALQANKVFKLTNSSSQQFNGLENTSSETTTVFDGYNNPTKVTTVVKNAGTLEQTTVTDIVYEDQPNAQEYYVGRPLSKVQSVSANSQTLSSEELYTYTNHLLTTIEKKGNDPEYITEYNAYDLFGNITTKTIKAPTIGSNPAPKPRKTSYAYDTTGRFLIKSTDIEDLSTTFVYNTDGTLKSETNPYGLTTTYIYDAWFKKTKTTDYLGKSTTYTYTRSGSTTLVTSTGDDGSSSQETFDDLGRRIKTGAKNLNGVWIYTDYLYDIYDRNYKTSEPYSGATASQWNETFYDAYGRPTQSKAFTGKIITIDYTYATLVTTVTDGPKTKTTTKNAIGNVVTMTESPGGTIKYSYYANGNLKETDYDGIITTITQDGWGRKTKLVDPSAGTYYYGYNGFGETTSMTTPNGVTLYELDDFGKIKKKTITGTNTNSFTDYVYDATSKLLLSTTFTDVANANAKTTNIVEYDPKKRIIKTTETTPYARFIKDFTYDAFGRVEKETSTATLLASGKSSTKTTKNTYQNGQSYQLLDDATSLVLWQATTVNARGQLLTGKMGNGIDITNSYDTYGYVTQMKHDKTGATPTNIMTLGTVFDTQKGNLSSRTNSLFAYNEAFTYDNLDRLITYPNAIGAKETQDYDDRGRITQNSIGSYKYETTANPYQNSSIVLTPEATTYYKNRSATASTAKASALKIPPPQPKSTIGLEITYNAFKSPVSIKEKGGNELYIDKVDYTYNDDNSRSTMFYGGLQDDKLLRSLRKHYSADGSMEIKENRTTGTVDFVTYLGGDGYTAPLLVKSDGTTQNYLYLHRDYQGSILAISNSTGVVVEKRLFDAWGSLIKYWNASGVTAVPTGAGGLLLDRGYTGHEHLLSFGIIHMNGRLYDPKLHRFLQPDNFVQEPFNTQNYNRYSYVLNNPLKYTDPSGESWWSNNWRSVVTVVASVATAVVIVASMGTATPLVVGFWAGAGAGLVGGSLGAFLNGGSGSDIIKGGIAGAFFGALSGVMGAYAAGFAPAGIFQGALYGAGTNAIIGGTVNLIQGNSWSNGIGLSVALGGIGGGYAGYVKAVNAGLNPWTGSPKSSTVTNVDRAIYNANVDKANQEAKIAFDKAMKAQAEATNAKNTISNTNENTIVRHHTSPEALKAIKSTQKLYPSRVSGGIDVGVDVEIQPFSANPNFGQAGKGAYVEFSIPSNQLTPLPHVQGGARILTGGSTLNLQNLSPTYVKPWFNW